MTYKSSSGEAVNDFILRFRLAYLSVGLLYGKNALKSISNCDEMKLHEEPSIRKCPETESPDLIVSLECGLHTADI